MTSTHRETLTRPFLASLCPKPPTVPDTGTYGSIWCSVWRWVYVLMLWEPAGWEEMSPALWTTAQQQSQHLPSIRDHCGLTNTVLGRTKKMFWIISSSLLTQVGRLSTCADPVTGSSPDPSSHWDHSPLLSLTMHSGDDGSRGLPCIVPHGDPHHSCSTHRAATAHGFICALVSP